MQRLQEILKRKINKQKMLFFVEEIMAAIILLVCKKVLAKNVNQKTVYYVHFQK